MNIVLVLFINLLLAYRAYFKGLYLFYCILAAVYSCFQPLDFPYGILVVAVCLLNLFFLFLNFFQDILKLASFFVFQLFFQLFSLAFQLSYIINQLVVLAYIIV